MINNIRYESLRNYTFLDADDTEVGSIEDLILSPSDLRPTHLLLGEGFFGEYLETLGKKPNVDEIAELSRMELIKDCEILIGQKLDDLEKTEADGKLPFDGLLYSDLKKYDIFYNEAKLDAEIMDYVIDDKNSGLVFYYLKLHDMLSMEGYRQKFEFIIPISKIQLLPNIIYLPYSEDLLIEKIKNEVDPKMSGKSVILM